MKTWQINVIGKVQGVSFRFYTDSKAKSLGLTGFVKNLPDGSVYIQAQGQVEALEQLYNWCYKGSPDSAVTEVVKKSIEADSFEIFEIQYN